MIDYTDPGKLRELLEKVTPGPWMPKELESPVGYARWEITFNADGELVAENVYDDADAQYIAAAREALPYWIERAYQAERAVERLASVWPNGHCIGFEQSTKCIEDCAACVSGWAFKEGEGK